MAVRFKFRSAVNFDSIDIDGKPSISVRDLRSKIIDKKNLKVCQDFDLVISDSNTGEEYEDENFLIPSGSSVIIKRVPAGRSAPSVLPGFGLVENLGTKQYNFIDTLKSSPAANVEVENFDDFGIDLYPAPEASLFDSDTDDDDKVNCANSRQADKEVLRFSGPSIVRHQNHGPINPNEAIPKGVTGFGFDGDTLQTKLKSKMEEQKKLDEYRVVDASLPAMALTDLPSELRCSLCNTIFKEAVMIPCCQHSFCNKCIRLVLVEKARCPKCSSTKCKVEDLLPNVSLRQAIEHFLESQGLISGSDNILPKYAPDEESGIQAKEFSCAVSIRQRDPLLLHSPGKGSNQVMTESAYESTFRNSGSAAGTNSRINLDASKRSATSSQKINQMRNGERDAVACPANLKRVPEGSIPVAEFEGENQPSKVPTGLMQREEVRNRKGLRLNTADGAGSFAATSKYRRGDRTCYMCGSPDHLIRDCPAASSQYPMQQTGDALFPGSMPAYGSPYWPGTPLPQFRPYANVYATPGMMPFDPNMVPVNPYTVPSYMPSMYAGMPVPYGLMRTGGIAPPMVTGAERPFMRAEFMDLQGSEQKHKLLNGHQGREKVHDGDDFDEGYYYNESQRSHDWKPQFERANSDSYSEDSDIQRSQRKHLHDKRPEQESRPIDRRHEKDSRSSAAGRDRRAHHFDGSSSEMQGTSNNSIRHSKDSRHNQRNSTKHIDSDSSRGRHHHQVQKEATTDKKRVVTDAKRQSRRYHSHTDSGPEPSSSGDRNKQRREKESSHNSRHSRHRVKSADDQLRNERWEMVDGSDDYYREKYHHHHHEHRHHHHKRKRSH